jgi:hypothetical protein
VQFHKRPQRSWWWFLQSKLSSQKKIIFWGRAAIFRRLFGCEDFESWKTYSKIHINWELFSFLYHIPLIPMTTIQYSAYEERFFVRSTDLLPKGALTRTSLLIHTIIYTVPRYCTHIKTWYRSHPQPTYHRNTVHRLSRFKI